MAGTRVFYGAAWEVAPRLAAATLTIVAMNCQRCGGRPATIHVTQIESAGGHAEAHLCSACCQEAGWAPDAVPPPVTELLAGTPAPAEAASPGADEPTCPECGLTMAEYQQVNLFGCAHDYSALGDGVGELIRRWHGAEHHVGRRPGDTTPAPAEAERADLETRLAAAVAGEHFEDAARLRDRIRQLDRPGTAS